MEGCCIENFKVNEKKCIYEYERLGTYRARKFYNTNCIVGHARPVHTEALIFIYICMHKCCIYLSILTHLFPSTYIYIYQFLPWLVCPIFFPSHDTSKLERDFLLVLNNCIHCTLYISCYTYAFESLLVES